MTTGLFSLSASITASGELITQPIRSRLRLSALDVVDAPYPRRVMP